MLKTTTTAKLAFYARFALILHAVFLIVFFLYIGREIIIPLFFSFLIAVLLLPLESFLERKKVPRGIACAIPILLFIIIITGLMFFFTKELGSFSKELPQVKEKFADLLQNARTWISNKYHIDDNKQKDYIAKSSHDIISFGIGTLGTTFVGTLELSVISIFCLIFSFFILYYKALLKQFIFSFFTREQCIEVKEVVKNIKVVINGYMVGLLAEMGLIILLSFTALSLLGIKYALLFSLLAAVLNLIPYFGIYTATAISMFIIFAQGTGNQALEAGSVFIAIHLIDSNFLLPKIVGGRVKMNPFIILVAVFAGKLLWGIPGMFLFIPMIAIFKIISESIKEFKPWAILLGEEKKVHGKVEIEE
jgi:AI-2 transport protein TqsA